MHRKRIRGAYLRTLGRLFTMYWYRPVTNDCSQPRALVQMPKSEEMRSRRMWSMVSHVAEMSSDRRMVVKGSQVDKIMLLM